MTVRMERTLVGDFETRPRGSIQTFPFDEAQRLVAAGIAKPVTTDKFTFVAFAQEHGIGLVTNDAEVKRIAAEMDPPVSVTAPPRAAKK